MAERALFHHVRGLTSGGVAFAEENCAAPVTPRTHRTHARPWRGPEGRTLNTVEEGVAHAKEIDFGEVLECGVRAVDGLPAGLVYAGFSLGVLPAQRLAQTRPGARGAPGVRSTAR